MESRYGPKDIMMRPPFIIITVDCCTEKCMIIKNRR